MRFLGLLILTLAMVICVAQEDTIRKIHYGIGAQSLLGGQGGMSFAGYGKVRYSFIELGLQAGIKSRKLEKFKSYDEVESNGRWIEPSVSFMIPNVKYRSGKMDFYETRYFKLGAGYGFMRSDNVFREIFEGQGPYDDYIYEDLYDNRESQYLRLLCGIHGDVYQRINIGFGVSYTRMWDADEIYPSESKMPFVITPLNGARPLAMYFELGLIL